MGGSVFGGQSHLVGERGPELFSPQRSGAITPLSKLMAGAGRGGAPVITNHITVNGDVSRSNLDRLADAIALRIRGSLHDGAYA